MLVEEERNRQVDGVVGCSALPPYLTRCLSEVVKSECLEAFNARQVDEKCCDVADGVHFFCLLSYGALVYYGGTCENSVEVGLFCGPPSRVTLHVSSRSFLSLFPHLRISPFTLTKSGECHLHTHIRQ